MLKKHAIIFYGTQEKLASVLGLTQSAVSQWGDSVPELYACKLEILTKGHLKAQLQDTQSKEPSHET